MAAKAKKSKKRRGCWICVDLGNPPSPLHQNVQTGRSALTKEHSKRIEGDLDCSVKIDGLLRQKNGQKIFDYLVVTKSCRVYLIEDHSASSPHHISELKAKKKGTLEILKSEATLGPLLAGLGWDQIRWIWTVSHGNIAFHGKGKDAKKIALLHIGLPTKKAVLL